MSSQDQTRVEEPVKRSYENSPWIHVPEWALQEHVNGETGERFWSVRIPKGTTIQHEGQAVDVSHYRFTTNVEPALTHGEAGSLKAVRGIHFPEGWEITLQRIENVAREGHEPIFDVTDKIEKVSPKELSDGLDQRAAEWRQSHRKVQEEQEVPGAAQAARAPRRELEPSL